MITQLFVQLKVAQSRHRLGLVFLFVFFIGLLSLSHGQVAAVGTIYYVKPIASGTGVGSSWADATTLQDALGDAGDGDEIWVAAGLYGPGASESDSFHLVPGAAVYGGFTGTETVRAQRDWAANLTILSGDIDNDDTNKVDDVVTDAADIVGANSDHVVVADGTTGTPITATTILDGFTITAGQSKGFWTEDGGGGFRCIGVSSVCSPSLTNISFSGNKAGFGGAMYNFGLVGDSSPTLINVSFYGNTASYGSAMYNFGWSGRSNPNLTNVTILGNSANVGGAINNDCDSNNSECNPSLTNVSFTSNTGSAMVSYCDYGSKCNPSLTNVSFTSNTAGYTSVMRNNCYGTGSECNPSLTNVSFSGNTVQEGSCGAMVNSGGEGSESSPILTNVSFSGNTAGADGGAMCNVGNSSPILTNVSFSGNTAGANGGAMYNVASSPILTNVILWGDIAASEPEIYNVGAGVTYEYSLIEGLDPDGEANLDGTNPANDPLFVDVASHDLRLQFGSPAIDAGDDSAPGLVGILTDRNGLPRFIDGDGDGSATVDMGAYEYVPTQEIPLAGGWNMISLYVQPLDSLLQAVLTGIETDVVLLKNGQGQVYWPAFGVDQIGNWQIDEGYEIYLNAAATLSVSGTAITPAHAPLSLGVGWNMVAYLRDSELDIETALAGISDEMIVTKNGDGLVYWPALDINEISNMVPGQGYQIAMNDAAILIYPDN